MLFSNNLSTTASDAPAIVTMRESVSYEAFHAAVAAFAARLHHMGVRKDDRVALWGYNSANWIVAFFAIVRAGGVAVLVNYSTEIADAANLLEMSGTQFIVCGDNGQTKRWDNAMGTLAEMAGIDPTHCVDVREKTQSLTDPQAFVGVDGLLEQRSADEASDTALVIFTSGTTSKPKAVCISQRALTTDALALADGLEGTMGPSICVSVPLFHILGLLTSYAYLMHGSTVCLPKDYRSATLAQIIGTHEVSDIAAVGAVYQGLADAEGFQTSVAPHVRTCMIAGGMSTPVQMMRLELQFTNATFINMYGQSEGAPLTMVRPSDLVERRAGTVGRVVSGVTLRIADTHGKPLSVGEVGEVQARGACLMNGYAGLPASEQAIDEAGWLHTGDIGFLDEDGYLHLAGRLKDVIIRGGENISPSEIEAQLTGIEGVRDAKVMGAPHPIFGESVEACVSMRDGVAFDEQDILDQLRHRIPRYKVPAHVFAFDSFPLNVNGKIDQRALYAHMINRLYTLEVEDELAGGITVFQIAVKNSSYAIEPVTALVSHLAENLGYLPKRADKLCLAVEEMLTERIMDAYSGVGDIHVSIALMADWLRISFTDDGAEYVIDKRRDTSMSARIILGSVDDFHTEWKDGKPVYCMDFLYDEYLDVKGYLLRSKEA
jgi:fatty-acyl-CoA synthase